jgi:hypothetical protein
MKRSGWRRIGMVLSVIWFVGFGGFLWIGETSHNADSYGVKLRNCAAILEFSNEPSQYILKQQDRAMIAIDSLTKYEICRSDAERFFLNEAEQLYRGIPILLGIDFATVIVGWALAWVVILVVRWINRGFASV